MGFKASACAKIMRSRIFNLVLLCFFILCAGIYNYGLHRSFWPDYEYIIPIYYRFLKEYFSLNMELSGIYDIPAYIPYRLFGCSLKAVRVYAATVYQLIMLFSTIAAVYSFKRKNYEWYKLGIFAFIAVILHPGSSPFCGHYSTYFHQYPYDMHAAPVVFAALSVMLLCIHQGMAERKHKNILKAIILIVIILGYKKSDFLYVVGFVGPLICVGLIYLWREKKKLFFALIFGIMAALALLHVISFAVPLLEPLFVHSSTDYGVGISGRMVYGNNGFADLTELGSYISITAVELLALFNIDIIGKSMLSIGTLIAGFRLLLVIFMFVCCFKIVIDAVRKEEAYESLDPVNVVLALGILFNFLSVMFSSNAAHASCIRYMTLILFYGAVLLARQSDNIIVKLHGGIDNKSKMYFFMFFSFAIIANMTTFWKADDYVADYEPAIENVSAFIAENNLGNGIGGHAFASTLTIIGEGKYAVVDGVVSGEGLRPGIGTNSERPIVYNYVVIWPESGERAYNYVDEEGVYQYLGEPDEVYEIDGFMIYYYAEGFE